MSRTFADPVRDTCSLTGHAGLVIGDVMYIQGGRMIYSGFEGFAQNPYLRVLNLTGVVRAQDIPDNIITLTDDRQPFAWNVSAQDTRSPMFWLDETGRKAYLALGAEVDVGNATYIPERNYNPGRRGKMWTADLLDGGILSNWVETDIRIGNRNPNLIGTGANWFDRQSRTGYAWGGTYIDGAEIDSTVNQLITFNASTGVWTNDTTPFTESVSGFMEGIILDDRPVLITGLGVTNDQEGVMDTMRVYDTRSKQWYSQRTNGQLPPNRFWTGCSTIVPAQDQSSYQIIYFGGANSSVTFGDVWSLSIPSFTWTQLAENVESSVSAGPRYAPTCDLMKDHYLVVVGGNHVERAYTYAFPQCDRNSNLAWFFDLNLLEWTSQVNGGTADTYRVPAPVYSAIGGGAEGGATLTQPPGGFDQNALATVFAPFAARATQSPTGTSGGGTGGGTPGSPESSSGSSISGGAIGGIVVGAIAIIALIGVGIWFFLRRRRQQPRDLVTPLPPPPPTSTNGAAQPDKGYIGYASVNHETAELQAPPHHVALRPELHGDSAVYNAELPGSTPNDYRRDVYEAPSGNNAPLLQEAPM
ncbi:hypothetical protein Dda_3747 [Drechslerella dactyloides]|uniref:Kelch repeat protein n=1 Tax=Drechslerella dactyloides TaxID=74499 RepID=A0AAD6NK25_DREDA|nr:hypothetical protein Dda_3747 [Drechslerella dactyloides]